MKQNAESAKILHHTAPMNSTNQTSKSISGMCGSLHESFIAYEIPQCNETEGRITEDFTQSWHDSAIGKRSGLAFSLLLAAVLLIPGGLRGAEIGEAVIEGRAEVAYDADFAPESSAADHDLIQSIELDIYGKENDHYLFTFFGEMREDLDGSPGGKEFDMYRSVDDSFNRPVQGYVYDAYLDVMDYSVLNILRLGRQYGPKEQDAHFDGAALDLGFFRDRIGVFVYGGLPVHFFEEEGGGNFMDGLAGGGLDLSLHPTSRIVAEFQYVRDRNIFETLEDRTTQLSIYQSVISSLETYGSIRIVDEGVKDYSLQLSGDFENEQLTFHLRFYHLVRTDKNRTIEHSPYDGFLGSLYPHQQFDVGFFKGFGDHVGISAGGTYRYLLDGRQESIFNHSFMTEYITLELYDVWTPGLGFSFSMYDWSTFAAREDRVTSVGGDVSYERSKVVRARAGSFYNYYKTNYYRDLEEKTDVTTVFLDLRAWIWGDLSFSAKYEVEIFSEVVHGVYASFIQEF